RVRASESLRERKRSPSSEIGIAVEGIAAAEIAREEVRNSLEVCIHSELECMAANRARVGFHPLNRPRVCISWGETIPTDAENSVAALANHGFGSSGIRRAR